MMYHKISDLMTPNFNAVSIDIFKAIQRATSGSSIRGKGMSITTERFVQWLDPLIPVIGSRVRTLVMLVDKNCRLVSGLWYYSVCCP